MNEWNKSGRLRPASKVLRRLLSTPLHLVAVLACLLASWGCSSEEVSATSGGSAVERAEVDDTVWNDVERVSDQEDNAWTYTPEESTRTTTETGGSVGSSSEDSSAPRSRDEIWAERMGLPRLYMSHPEMRERIASRGPGPHVDAESAEVYWPVRACNAPDCPARSAEGEPHRFIVPNPGMFGASGAKLGTKPTHATSTVSITGGCPECEGMAGLSAEDIRRRQVKWVRPYVLPESAKRMAELDAERRRLAWERAHR